MAQKKPEQTEIVTIERGRIQFSILGTSPLICEAMSAKVRQDLLLPPQKKNAAAKASSLKHNPVEEFRSSVYRSRGDIAPTRIVFPSTAFKKALAGVAVDLPGSTKAQIGRLTFVEGAHVSIYGIPELMMSVTRSAGMNRTPDVRSRAILPEWACQIEVTYIRPVLKRTMVTNLLGAAGMMQGIGGWRPEKGAGDFGRFTIVSPEDPDFKRIMETGGMTTQDVALETPRFFDSETEQLYGWFKQEAKDRGFREAV